MFSRRASWISVFHHPFLLGSGCFLFILYKLFPSLLVFLVKSSPVIACTALLLGIILLNGEPNIPEAKEGDRRARRIKNKERTKENNAVKRRKNKGMTSKGRSMADRKDIAREHSDIEQVDAGTLASSSFVAAHNRRKKLTKNREHSADKLHRGLAKANKNVNHATSDKRRADGLKLNISRCNFEQCFDSTVGSPWQHVNHHDASSKSDSDNVESSGSSEEDAIPMIHEFDPLLDSGAPQPAVVSCYNSDDAGPATVPQDLESDDDSIEEEAENQEDEDEDDDDDDDEAHEEKEDDNKAAVTWTADDQRTLVHLGNSELERNHRVENLIAMRRARRALWHEKERNLIELDGNDIMPGAAEMSHFSIQLPSIYAPKGNPFDLPFDSEDIPGSAPSVLLPRRNPFDLPYDQVEQNGTVAIGNLNHHDVVAPPIRDMLFRRHESFTIGAPFFGDPSHDRRSYMFKPYFSAERMGKERIPMDTGRQPGEANALESSTASSLSDQELQRNLQEMESTTDHNVEFTDQASRSSEEAESVDMDQMKIGTSLRNDRGIDLDNAMSIEQIHQSNTSEELRGHAFATGLAYSSRGIVAASGIPSKRTGHVPENQIVDPVYDSSPSARSHSNTSPKGSTGEEGSSVSDSLWVAPSLASIDQIESTSREISVIRERDVIGDELSKVHQGFGGGGIVPTLPELAARQSLLYSMSGMSSGRRSSAGS